MIVKYLKIIFEKHTFKILLLQKVLGIYTVYLKVQIGYINGIDGTESILVV